MIPVSDNENQNEEDHFSLVAGSWSSVSLRDPSRATPGQKTRRGRRSNSVGHLRHERWGTDEQCMRAATVRGCGTPALRLPAPSIRSCTPVQGCIGMYWRHDDVPARWIREWMSRSMWPTRRTLPWCGHTQVL